MPSLDLEIEYDDATIHPVHAFVCESPVVEREVLLEGTRTGDTRTLLFYVEGERTAYESVLAERPGVREYDLTPEGDDAFYVYTRVENRDADVPVFEAFDQQTLVVVPPIEFRSDRTARFTVVGHPDDLQAAIDDMPEGASPTVQRVGGYAGAVDDGLTARQREALAVAWEAGFYEVPRDGGIEDVAAELGCAVSTASDLLRRAESRLVGDVLGERY
ncbi:helix-turn-helix domain-containing protein [Halobacterium bonnevillei]|uniref:Bacterio-opsin activator n=1 Tax=Halobacterium bonnevillei TaxID=2692200 RepID=A0A6B0SDC6_9EURY|nr:helix-turn-helix domain-containing protein [Halobacterium bonnevillei]MXR19398.1 bacterio-opsin activator [Halobacterium bonnevillei]